MIKVLVNPGICGFETVIEAVGYSDTVKPQIKSDCEEIKKFAISLPEISLQDLRNAKSFTKNKIYTNADRYIHHFSCPIPCAIMKAIETELGLALGKNVEIKFLNAL